MTPSSRMALGLFLLIPALLTGVLVENLRGVLSQTAPATIATDQDDWQAKQQTIQATLAEHGVTAREARFWRPLTETPDD